MHPFRLFASMTVVIVMCAAPAPAQHAEPSTTAPARQGSASPQPANTSGRLDAVLRPDPRIRGDREARLVLVSSPGRVAANPAAFYGLPVSLHAGVGRVLGPRAFTLDPAAWSTSAGELTVLVPQPAPRAPGLSGTEYVTVVGTVRMFVRADFEREYDWIASVPGLDVQLEGQPVVIADRVRRSDGEVLTRHESPSPTLILATRPGYIADTPGRFFGRSVAIASAEVDAVWTPRVFTLDEDELFAGPDVLVFNPNPVAAVDGQRLEDDVVTVFGVVRPLLVAEFETDYEWFDAAEYDAHDLARFERRPVIVASSVTRASGQELVQFRPELALDRAQSGLSAHAQAWRTMDASQPAGTAGSTAPAPAPAAGQRNTQPALRDVSALLLAGRDDVVGRRVVLDRIQVIDVVDPQTVVVGPSRVHTVAVRLTARPSMPVEAGQHVRVEGILRRTPTGASWNTPLFIEPEAFDIVN